MRWRTRISARVTFSVSNFSEDRSIKLFLLLLTAATAFANSDFESGAAALARQPDGKIVAVGSSSHPIWMERAAIARFLPNGKLDTTFGKDGKVTLDLSPHCDTARAVAIQTDGKIVFAGTRNYTNGCPKPTAESEGYVGRLNADGSVDSAFGSNGYAAIAWPKSNVDITALALPPGGGILFAGHRGTDAASAFGTHFFGRLTATGAPDALFDSTICAGLAKCTSNVKAMELSADGKRVYLAGAKFIGNITYYAEAYALDGTPDAAFGSGGRAEIPIGGYGRGAETMALGPKGEVYLGGSGNHRGNKGVTVVKLDAAGNLDTSFADAGKLEVSLLEDVHQLRKLRVANGRVNLLATAFCVTTACPIPGLTHSYVLGLVRLTPSGKFDTTFGQNGRKIFVIGQRALAGDLLALPHGELFVAADSYIPGTLGAFGLAKFDDLGAADPTFGQNGALTEPIF